MWELLFKHSLSKRRLKIIYPKQVGNNRDILTVFSRRYELKGLDSLLQLILIGLSVGGIYALIASGYALVYSLLRFSNWAHGEVAMLGAYIALTGVVSMKLPFWASALLGILFAGVVSVLNERIAYKRIRDNHAPSTFLMIAAMGLSTTFQNIAMLVFGAKFKSFPQIFSNSSIVIGGAYIGKLDIVALLISAVALIILEFTIHKTKFGLSVRAMATDSETSSLLGINIDRSYTLVFLIAGVLAGCAGVLLGMKYNVYPEMGNVGLKAFIASVVGGLGSVSGAIIGAVIIGILETFVSIEISSGLKDFFVFALLIAILLIKPSGLLGKDVQDKA